MSATPGKLLKQAKQGDPKAIAALMNRSTQAKGISVKASLKDRCLQVLLEGNVVPHQGKTVEFVRDGMAKLQVEGVDRVKVYGRQVGQETPVWQDEIVFADTNPFDEEGDDADLELDDHEDPSAISDTDFPDPPMGADSFLDEGLDQRFEDEIGDQYDDDLYEDDYEEGEDGEQDDDEEAEEDAAAAEKKKPGVTIAAVLAVLVLLILGGGYYVYTSRPELLEGLPFFERDAEGNLEFTSPLDDSETEAEAEAEPETAAPDEPQGETAVDPFALAVSAAIEASEKTQAAQSAEEWQEIAELWQTAIAQMQAVPEDHPQYEVAQDRAESYQDNLQYAQQQAQ
ncbi:hypothetical protein E1H12_19175 [Geitlerinema sp. P-1104]|uniref:hypothetical protein n=1 Tax=Geitlerinema sp. P-1104 TaxID=2546230 RepID=UPI001476968E|nr:hypothetical protein [Geitlerinema sp. P-1104]NMG60575.1 hypothetical protein [Geitlerinema sp. P-1104]